MKNDKGIPRQYRGVVDVYRKTIKSDGFVGLYRGFNISVVGIVVYRSLYFGLYDSIKPLIAKNKENNQNKYFDALSRFVLGWGVTILSGFATYPFETFRHRMMVKQ